MHSGSRAMEIDGMEAEYAIVNKRGEFTSEADEGAYCSSTAEV